MSGVSFLWLAAALAALLLIERWIHRHLQGIMLLATGDPEITVVLYALPLLPGILLHELSHALAAILLGVRIGRISIHPRLSGQRVQLGFIPVEKTDAVRASLIGLAPLLTGSLVILLIGYGIFGIGAMETALATQDWAALPKWLAGLPQARDAWLWAYAIFAVSNTMLPSRADRQAWMPVLLFLLLVGVIVGVAGWGPALLCGLSAPLGTALRWLAVTCTLTLTVDLVFALPITLAERFLERVRGYRVDYQS